MVDYTALGGSVTSNLAKANMIDGSVDAMGNAYNLTTTNLQSFSTSMSLIKCMGSVPTFKHFNVVMWQDYVVSGKTAIPSLNGTAVRRFPDEIDELDMTEIKNVLSISSSDAKQINDYVLYTQQYGGSVTVLTRILTDVSQIQGLINNGLVSVGKIPGINSSGVANLSNSTSAGIGAGSAAIGNIDDSEASDGGFLLYPNQVNNNMMRSVYAK